MTILTREGIEKQKEDAAHATIAGVRLVCDTALALMDKLNNYKVSVNGYASYVVKLEAVVEAARKLSNDGFAVLNAKASDDDWYVFNESIYAVNEALKALGGK